jgi:hypothetical protein
MGGRAREDCGRVQSGRASKQNTPSVHFCKAGTEPTHKFGHVNENNGFPKMPSRGVATGHRGAVFTLSAAEHD